MVLSLIKVFSNNNYQVVSLNVVNSYSDAKQIVRAVNQYEDTHNKKYYYEGSVEDTETKKKYDVLWDGCYFSEPLFEARCKKYKIGKYNV